MAKQPIEALDIMEKVAGKSLDPNILAVLKSVMGSFPIGTLVRLDSMEVGVVTGVGTAGEGQIRITILIDRRGNRLPHPEGEGPGESEPKTKPHRMAILGSAQP